MPAYAGLAPRHRKAAVVTGAIACAWLVPWSGHLARTLPSATEVNHWSLAWTGLDLAEAATAAGAAWLLARGDRRAGPAAAAFAALLCADAWFDLCTAKPGSERTAAAAEALLLELPFALGAAWVASRVARQP